MGAGWIKRALWSMPIRLTWLLSVAAQVFFLFSLAFAPALAQQTPVPRTKQEVRNKPTPRGKQANQQYPPSGYNSSTPASKRANQQLPPARKRTTTPSGTSRDRQGNQFPTSGYNNGTPASKRANQQLPPARETHHHPFQFPIRYPAKPGYSAKRQQQLHPPKHAAQPAGAQGRKSRLGIKSPCCARMPVYRTFNKRNRSQRGRS